MKKTKRDALIACGCSLTINILSLLIIPAVLLGLFSAGTHISGNHRQNVNKVEIPKEISVYITATGETKNIAFEDYITGVVASEMPSSFEDEALKAQAVAARTYSLSKVIRSGAGGFPEAHPQAPLCDSIHCQAYNSKETLAALKGDEWMKNGYTKVKKAVDDTRGEVMYFDGELVSQALFHSSSGGRTENSEDVFASAVPYLRSVDSPYEEEATHKNEQVTVSLLELASALNQKYQNRYTGNFTARDIQIKSRTEGGTVAEFAVGNAVYSGREIREALGLASATFDASSAGEYVTFTTNGYGHGVGMSQYGANGMAKKGADYREILSHYYSGVVIQ